MPPAPTLMDARLRTLGYDGSKIWSGQLDRQEWHRDLQDPFAKQKIFQEMLENQPEIARGSRDVSDQLKTGKWPIKPPKGLGKNKAAKALADRLQAALEGMSTPWTDVLEDCLSGIPFGYNLSEITWKNDGGMWLPDRIERRPQWTAYGWLKDADGRIVAFRQRDPMMGTIVDIPLKFKALHLTFGAGTTGPEGVAGLRCLWVPYKRMNRIVEISLIAEEHSGAGCWIGEIPAEILKLYRDGDANSISLVDDMLASMSQLSVGERNAAIMPSPHGLDGKPTGWDLRLAETKSSASTRSMDLIRFFREQIMVGLGTQYLLLGMGGGSGGGRAQSSDQTGRAREILQGIGDAIADGMTRQWVRPICELNGVDPGIWPSMSYQHPKKLDVASLAQLLTAAQNAGVSLVDETDRDDLREIGSLPRKESE